MRAVVRRLHSPDADLATFVPGSDKTLAYSSRSLRDPRRGSGEESFDVTVCTPRWLQRWVEENGPTSGKALLGVAEYDEPRTRVFLTDAVESQEAETWSDLALKIGRIGTWEFEDYRP